MKYQFMTHTYFKASLIKNSKRILLASACMLCSLPGIGATSSSNNSLPLNEVRTFTEVLDRIKKAYVEPIDDQTLLENAIKGMLSELDPHSAYLEPDAFKDLQESTHGEFGGLGIEVGMKDGFVEVITPIDDTPAQKAGVEAGDLIIKLDDNLVKGLSLNDAVKIMRGKPGTKIKLTIIRENEREPLEISITRAAIKVVSVKSKILEEGFGYIRITQFQINTGKNLEKAVHSLTKKGVPLKGLVLDLRNNPGGVLDSAVDVTDVFINDGLVVYTKGRLADTEMEFEASENTLLPDIPLVVLVNGGSASASEIVAGALQDHHRAIIMGTLTFGKGSVQTVLPLHNNRALKLTTARYYTPKGRSIQAKGIKPDIIVEASKVTKLNRPEGYKESDLAGHLENEVEKPKTKKSSAEKIEELLEVDFQLREALNLLKGIYLHNQAHKS